MSKSKREQSFADFVKQLQKQKVIEAAPVEILPERRYFLIVCEGERTEPIYFEYLKKFLPRDLLRTVSVEGIGDNTYRVVQAAIRIRDERNVQTDLPPFDEVWAVYDKDSFPNPNYDNAVKMALAAGIESGHSNECFELWYLLHFNFLDTALHREDYFKRLTGILGFKYAKNTDDVVQFLFDKGNVRQAIKWAKDLSNMHVGKTPSNCLPYTRVYQLVENLLEYSKAKV